MKTIETTRLFAAVLLASSSVVACSGADGELPGAGSAATDERAPSPSSGDETSPARPATGAGNDAGASQPAPIARHCAGSGKGICLDTDEAPAGEVVELDVVLAPSSSCTVDQAYGRLIIDASKFELVNVADQVDCTSRHQVQLPSQTNGDELITWQKFGGGAIAGCPDPVAAGKVDVIRVRIKPGTPPGDYEIAWETSELLGASCFVTDDHHAGKIRVLP